jgi:hypothetical protein
VTGAARAAAGPAARHRPAGPGPVRGRRLPHPRAQRGDQVGPSPVPRPPRLRAPPDRRRQRRSAGGDADRRQPPRRHPAHPAGRGGAADPGTATATAAAAAGAVRRPRLRLRHRPPPAARPAASRRGSPAAASRTARVWASSAGSFNEASPGCTPSSGCAPGMNAAPTSTSAYFSWPAPSSATASWPSLRNELLPEGDPVLPTLRGLRAGPATGPAEPAGVNTAPAVPDQAVRYCGRSVAGRAASA